MRDTVDLATGELVRVDELARRAGISVRHVRTLAGKGLLDEPVLRGRTGFYGQPHLDQLRRIAELQERGWSVAAIEDLLGRSEPDAALAELLPGLDLATPRTPEAMTPDGLARRLGAVADDPTHLGRLRAAGIVTGDDETPVVQVPEVVDALRAMTDRGIPAAETLALTERLAPMVDHVADEIVTLVAEQLFQPLVDADDAAPDATQQAVTAILELHPHALAAAVGLLGERLVARAAERVQHRMATGAPLHED